MKESILSQISELNQDDKSRLYKVIKDFLFDNEVDITKQQNEEKVAVANNCPHCESTKTRKNGHQYGFQRVFVNKKRGINYDKVAILISCDSRGNKHLQVARRGRISAADINTILKDKLEPKTVLCNK